MSLLYKNPEDVIYSVDINQEDDKIIFHFWADCGKHGTDESLGEHTLTPKQLLDILQKHEEDQMD